MILVIHTCHNWTTVISQELDDVEWSDKDLNELADSCEKYYHEIFDDRIICNREKNRCYEVISGKLVDKEGRPVKGGAMHVEISDMFLWGLAVVVGVWVL